MDMAKSKMTKKEKSKYTAKELQMFGNIIQEKIDRAASQLAFYESQITELTDNPDNKIKGLDDGNGSQESERMIAMAARQKKLIHHLEMAKLRIQNGVYGVCRATGKLISKERLKAVPHATLSIEAKEKGLG